MNGLKLIRTIYLKQWSAAAYLVSIGKCSAHPLLAHVIRTCSCDFGMGLRVIFFSTSARFFVAAAEDLSAKQRNVSLQHAARKLRVCYTHTNARQTCDGMCVPTTDLK